ncbi:MAG: EamA family transporter, partial [Proteobacteria bacterium]|nr:EamA family transporter [Pseudomonadota bacterium]
RLALVWMGLLFLVNNVCFLTAYEKTTVANAVLTHYTAPLFVAVLAPLAIRERVLPVTPVALLLAAVGMALLLPGVRLAGRTATSRGWPWAR